MEVKITDKVKIRKITKWLIGVVTSCLPYAPMVGTLVSVNCPHSHFGLSKGIL